MQRMVGRWLSSWVCVALGATVASSAACGDSDESEPGTGGTGGIAPAGGFGGSMVGGNGGMGNTTSGGAGGTGGVAGSGGTGALAGGGPCPDGVTCIGMDELPFRDERDTSAEGESNIDAYSCSPDTNESGPEILYRATVPADGFISVAVYDEAGVDIDVHILEDLDVDMLSGDTCLDRGDIQARADIVQGDVWIVADTYVNGGGTPQSGAYTIDIGFVAASQGPCTMLEGEMPRVGDGGDHLEMPATGPIVREAHLVTADEPAPFPQTPTEELAEHFALSQEATGLVMVREQLWAPLEGGGNFYGAGIGDPAEFPALHEGWYVNMFWTAAARPPKGTRMILRHPDDPSRAVVVAAGYETGPGNLSMIGGTTEETHFYMGTEHADDMILGIAMDQALPFGPRVCTD